MDIQKPGLLRKIDWRVVPLLFACYFLQFLDKIIINYAFVMGLQEDLGMKGNDFSWFPTAFFIGFALAELPQSYLLQKYPLAKVLGCFEACMSPALVLSTSQWYTKREAGPRYGFWYCGLGAGQILGGLISFGAQHGDVGTSFGGWRIMMVAVGVFNIFVAVAVLLFLPDSLESAKFLTEGEKDIIRRKLALGQGGNGVKVFRAASV
ncbi:hypothetical protein FOPG_18344 [Fusarium oxysporum f. sp. conglutinans race 2 54008]|uniref:Major facilitator superfamily (MFS) profile domain-containing protein n=1 Tax=Fusarium oxysporum f. sp. conglutinans race 2 54008 TaxID=1089457 RepID=X0GPA1_FUSOX|nr:hypothetical protein FOPG_18344 [Fusarium oxysporum f. sp. conglutinans race 2 54008]